MTINDIILKLDWEQAITPYSEVGYGINKQVKKSKNLIIVKFTECDLNQLFSIFVDNGI